MALSGGGARGSFQLGALAAIYDAYGFRPDFISGTSVGSVNGIKLATARPPVVNNPTAILASVAAGNPDSGIAALRALEVLWNGIMATGFFAVQPAFKGTLIEDLAESMNAEPTGDPPLSATVGAEIDKQGALLATPIISTFSGPVAADKLQQLKGTVMAVLTQNSIFNLDPIKALLNDRTHLKPEDLATGTPLYLAAVALESGRLRYIDGMGNLTERDGVTPVLSALTTADITRALDENLAAIPAARAAQINGVLTRYLAAIAAITAGRATYRASSTTNAQRVAVLRDIARNTERATYLLDALRAQIQGLRLMVRVDPRQGVLASAAIPAFFDPIVFGAERYVDGGLRELVPMEIAVQSGVTDIVGICCSPLELPAVDDMSSAGLAAVGLRALTEIALNEVTDSDIVAARAKGITCTVIAPTFNVHSSFTMNPTLVEISSEYGWMRACDEMQPASDADRADFRRFSDLITTFRMRGYPLDRYIEENTSFYQAGGIRDSVATMRTYRWLIRELLAMRANRGLPQHPQARRWWTGWSRQLRSLPPFGRSSVWSRLAVSSSNGVEILVAEAVSDPDTYAPDTGALVDAGNDRVYWIVRGAVFQALGETEATTTHTPVTAVPHGTMIGLQRVPRGSHLMAEQGTPSDIWIVRNGMRYRSTPATVTASGMGGQAVAIVPPGGLNQIPDGGSPHWLGGLFLSDSAGNAVDRWEPTPQVEGSSSVSQVMLFNRSGRPVQVTGLAITSSQDTGSRPMFAVNRALPLSVQTSTLMRIDVQTSPVSPGPVTGSVSVTCDDPTVSQFSVPLVTSVTPLGRHGRLEISPGSVDIGRVRVGQPAGTNVTLTNIGTRDLSIVDLKIIDSVPEGQFGIPVSPAYRLGPGASTSVHIACTPTQRGRLTATLSVDISSETDTPHPFRQHGQMTLSATAIAPVVFLSDTPLPPRLASPIRLDPVDRGPTLTTPVGLLAVELIRLDFGESPSGTTAVRTFWVRNVGDAPLSVTGVNTYNQGAFGFPNLTVLPAVVAPGGEIAIDTNFLAPPKPGTPVESQLEILTDDPLRPRAQLTVVGRASGPHLSLNPIELLNLDSGLPPAGELTITSDGTDPVSLTKVGVTDSAFSYSGFPPLPATLAPGTVLTISVTYTGTNPGRHVGHLQLEHDGRVRSSVILQANV
ncbi:hypothetical protein Rhe02_65560 [Rhizocola hellebori]|uniref:PNPLA domain-containing protein n=1 Tax=Rhizocola hellebori TaxID=1392758 RepID=A0A8J3QCY8_9ACTN|nr:hypothetical protein Rhe02_65560 [Rhizocola hellebori]